MCDNCKNSQDDCDCDGGEVFAVCACHRGYDCVVCGHEPAQNTAGEHTLLVEILEPGFVASLR